MEKSKIIFSLGAILFIFLSVILLFGNDSLVNSIFTPNFKGIEIALGLMIMGIGKKIF